MRLNTGTWNVNLHDEMSIVSMYTLPFVGHLNKGVQQLSQIPPTKLNMSFFFPVNNMLHMQRARLKPEVENIKVMLMYEKRLFY